MYSDVQWYCKIMCCTVVVYSDVYWAITYRGRKHSEIIKYFLELYRNIYYLEVEVFIYTPCLISNYPQNVYNHYSLKKLEPCVFAWTPYYSLSYFKSKLWFLWTFNVDIAVLYFWLHSVCGCLSNKPYYVTNSIQIKTLWLKIYSVKKIVSRLG